jgi:hypothetical protein
VHAQAFLDARVEVGQFLERGVRRRVRQGGGTQFGDEMGFCARGAQDVVEDAFDDDGEGVGAAEDLGGG